ncbi:energy-coupling factor transporter transmembrane component T [uncultured Corynebacterium sp.]|uniref:energy-coupling factor transporter transmembrane component T n=1 Tax=uncultured Corynebacterium sp. TaxID=159447 RepID=UPI0025E2F16E|nr:energy-coupling factor transporter transmembrane component T [uncultured Corynebacterium sp.]
MNPLTPLTAAVCAVAVVMVAHEPVVSASFLVGAALLALIAGRRHRRALAASLFLAVPATVSYGLIYVPFADDGWATTADLSLRFAGMTTAGLVLLSFVDADALMRDLQLRIPAPLVYMVGSVVRLLPMAQQRWRTIRQVQFSRGVPDTWRARTSCVLPLVVGLVVDAGNRSRPLQRTGIGEPGRRTVLVPVPDPAAGRIARWMLVVASLVAVVVAVM